MLPQYHRSITHTALAAHFSDAALDEIVAANLAQDAWIYQLGTKAHYHFDNNGIAEGLSYIEELHRTIAALAEEAGGGQVQRVAFGRLCHAAQDFYAHSNYVDLWLAGNGGLVSTVPSEIDGLDQDLLSHPDLRTGTAVVWRDWIYHFWFAAPLARRIPPRPGSHQAMNLDSPEKGPRFDYAVEAAVQRTLYEYTRAADAILRTRGKQALVRFTDGA
ncbi:MAG: hypothetical protein L6435_06745 [Anaerolineae bacterium]|nr:hypothetical protein [Anaerolineae bacterium]